MRVLTCLALCAALVGCKSWDEERNGQRRVLTGEQKSDDSGYLEVTVPTSAADASMLIEARPEAGYMVFVDRVEDVDGGVLYDFIDAAAQRLNRSGGQFVSEIGLFNWPVGLDDTPLNAGEVVVHIGVAKLQGESFLAATGIPVDLRVITKQDPDFSSATLTLNLVLAGQAATDPEVARALDNASFVIEEIFEDIGITVTLTQGTYAEGNLPAPGRGAPADYLAISEGADLGTVNVVLAPTVHGSPDLLGISGGVPGPLGTHERAAVLVSTLMNSGPDMIFDDVEVNLLGETISHEVGHYIGLFHPVEVNDGDWNIHDALDDTPNCDEQEACEDVLGRNLMFPYALCGSTDCAEQRLLTTEQAGVAHRYTGAL